MSRFVLVSSTLLLVACGKAPALGDVDASPPPRDGSPPSDGSMMVDADSPPSDAGADPDGALPLDASPPPPVPTDCVARTGTGATLHVRTDGSDACDGSADAPAGGSACAFATIQAAVDAMRPGDTVVVHGGTYGGPLACPADESQCAREPNIGVASALVYFANRAGREDAPLVVRAAAGERVVLDGDGTIDSAIWLTDSDYVTVEGFEIRDFTASSAITGPRGGYGAIVVSTFSTGTQIIGNTITGTDPAGVSGIDAGDIRLHGSRETDICGNTITTTLPDAIVQQGRGGGVPLVGGQIAYNHVIQTVDVGSDPRRAVILKRVAGMHIVGNVVELTAPAVSGSTGIYLREHEDCVVQGNVVIGFADGFAFQDEQPSQGGIDNEHERTIFTNNVFHGIEPSPVRTFGLAMWGGYASCDGCQLRSNVFIGFDRGFDFKGDASVHPTRSTISHNLMFDVGDNRFDAGDVDVEPTNDFSLGANPLVGSGAIPFPRYEPADGSPAIDSGWDGTCPWPARDGDGDGTATCDVGAFER